MEIVHRPELDEFHKHELFDRVKCLIHAFHYQIAMHRASLLVPEEIENAREALENLQRAIYSKQECHVANFLAKYSKDTGADVSPVLEYLDESSTRVKVL